MAEWLLVFALMTMWGLACGWACVLAERHQHTCDICTRKHKDDL